MKIIYSILLSLCGICLFFGCHSEKNKNKLEQAEYLFDACRYDDVLKQLAMISTSSLSEEERMRMAWLQGYTHFRTRSSVLSDTLFLKSHQFYLTRQDSIKAKTGYLVRAYMARERQHPQMAQALLDSGIQLCQHYKDSLQHAIFLIWKADYALSDKDFRTAIKCYHSLLDDFRSVLGSNDSIDFTYNLGICYGLLGKDSAHYYYRKSMQMASLAGDTTSLYHFMRNYAQQLIDFNQPKESIKQVDKLARLSSAYKESCFYGLIKADAYLRLHQLDSARYYLNKIDPFQIRNNLTIRNEISTLTSLLDFLQYGRYNNTETGRYNDSVIGAFYHQQHIIRQDFKEQINVMEQHQKLELAHQQMLSRSVIALLMIIIICSGLYLYARNRNIKLIEAQEKIETLQRLVQETEGRQATDSSKDTFFKHILLQQLGIVRAFAASPTVHNQEMLQKIISISNKQTSVESLLVWDDLYPIIDNLYDNFYSRMHLGLGNLLTEKEEQLCCLMRAEFTTKEISAITQQSLPTIYKRKTTIRKKLQMEEKEDIIQHIQSISTPNEGI